MGVNSTMAGGESYLLAIFKCASVVLTRNDSLTPISPHTHVYRFDLRLPYADQGWVDEDDEGFKWPKRLRGRLFLRA